MHGLNASSSLSEARCLGCEREGEGAGEIRPEERKRKERIKEGKRVGTRRDTDTHRHKPRGARGLPNAEERGERESGLSSKGLREGCGSGRFGRREDAAGV